MKVILAEFIGTFCLVFAGCGAIVANTVYGGAVTHVGICITFGLTVMAMIYSVGNISGAHLNPAVTMGFCFAGRMQWKQAPAYMVAQFAGGTAGAALLSLIYADAGGTLGVTLPSSGVFQSLGMEVTLTFILMFVILNVSTGAMEKGIMAGAAIGATVTLEALFGGPVSGASMNPARSLGPALMSGNLQHIWIYFAGPILGALLASPWCRIVQGDECCHVRGNNADEKQG